MFYSPKVPFTRSHALGNQLIAQDTFDESYHQYRIDIEDYLSFVYWFDYKGVEERPKSEVRFLKLDLQCGYLLKLAQAVSINIYIWGKNR